MAVAELVTSKLAYFNELETTTAVFQQFNNNTSSTVDYLSLLQKLDDSLQYISSHPHYLDAPAYSTKLRQLQSRTLSGIRSKVAASLRAASQQAQRQGEEEERERQGNKEQSSSSETASSTTSAAALQSLLHVRFRAAAEPQLKDLLHGLEQKAKGGSRPEYTRLLRDCEILFCEARLALLQPPTAARFQDAQKKTAATVIISTTTTTTTSMSLVDFLRDGCAHLIQLAQVEYQLFSNFFPDRAVAVGPAVISPLMDPLCTLLYDAMRPATVSLNDIDALCDLINVLQTEIVGNTNSNSEGGSTGNATVTSTLEPALRRTLADLQERLTWRAQAFVREEILAFTPTPQDLDYPAVLGIKEEEEEAGEEGIPSSSSPFSSLLWYPPVRKALFLLSKIYRAVPSQSFNGLAQEAIAAAMSQVLKGGRTISSTATAVTAASSNDISSSASAGAADGHLFTIRQLLILREQIAMYQSDFAAVIERDLDFSHTREAIRQMMTGQLPFLSLSFDNAVLQLVSKGAPRLLESQLDAKKELERQLKAACETFIMFATKLAVEPLLTFITKVTAVRVVTSSSNSDQKPLKEHAFASPDRLSEVAAAVNAALTASLPNVISKIRLYITNPTTQSILVKPIVSNIGEAHGQIASLLSGEYSEEEAGKIGFMDAKKLKETLNSM